VSKRFQQHPRASNAYDKPGFVQINFSGPMAIESLSGGYRTRTCRAILIQLNGIWTIVHVSSPGSRHRQEALHSCSLSIAVVAIAQSFSNIECPSPWTESHPDRQPVLKVHLIPLPTSPLLFSPLWSFFRSPGQYHLTVRGGSSTKLTHSIWNHWPKSHWRVNRHVSASHTTKNTVISQK
jgi:hypothetical protein